MIWRRFLKSSAASTDAAWWERADRIAAAPSAGDIDQLAQGLADPLRASDELERQQEMIEGLRILLETAALPSLPVLVTQHRVIGNDVCHWVAPVSLAAETGAAGKLFVTSARLVFAGGRVVAWPWHRVQRVARAGRDIVVLVSGAAEPLQVQCNTYGDALVVAHLAGQFSKA